MSVDPYFQAKLVFRSGLAALVPGMFAMGWLGSGKPMHSHPLSSFFSMSLDFLCWTRRFTSSGKAGAAPKLSGVIPPGAQKIRRQFAVVVILEFAAFAILSGTAYVIRRSDLAPVLAAAVVGVHFLPLGRMFR
jgi:hypothetical protein